MEGAVMKEVWREEGTSASGIEAALRQMIWRSVDADEDTRPWLFPPQALNLVVIVDAGSGGEIETRLRRAGRLQPARLVVCAVQEDRRLAAASASKTRATCQGV